MPLDDQLGPSRSLKRAGVTTAPKGDRKGNGDPTVKERLARSAWRLSKGIGQYTFEFDNERLIAAARRRGAITQEEAKILSIASPTARKDEFKKILPKLVNDCIAREHYHSGRPGRSKEERAAQRPDKISLLERARETLFTFGDDLDWVIARAIDETIRTGTPLETVLDLPRNWYRHRRARRRQEACLAAKRLCREKTGRPMAKELRGLLVAYERSRWPEHNQDLDQRPDGNDGLLFDILSQGPVPSEEWLRKILG